MRSLLHSNLQVQLLLKQACRQLFNRSGLMKLFPILLSAQVDLCDHSAAVYAWMFGCLPLLCPAAEEPRLQATAHSCTQSAI